MDISKIKPRNDHVLVRRMPFDETTSGGLIIPEIAKAEHKLPRGRGIVLAVGPGKLATKPDPHDPEPQVAMKRRVVTGEREPMTVVVGDDVIFSRMSGTPLDIAGDDILLIREEHVMLTVEPG